MQRPPEYARLLDEGTTLRQQGRLEEAVRVLQTASQLVSDDPALWSELAHAMRWQGQYGPAEEAARKALSVQPEHAPALFNLGAILADTGRVNEGIASYRKALQFKPDFAEAWSNLGMALGMIGKPEEEVDAYRRALEVNPALAMVWSNLGSALAGLGRFDEAVEACRRAVSVDAEYAIGWSNLADVLRQAGNFEEAVTACSKALQLEPGMASAWLNLGVISIERGDRVEAESAFRRAVELDPSIAAAWSGLGGVLERRDALADAIAAHERAVAIDAGNATWIGNLVRAYWKAKQPGKAVTALKRTIQHFPDHAGLRADLVNSMLEICDWSGLESHLSMLAGAQNWCVPGQEVTPFGSIMWCDDDARNLEVARAAAARIGRRFRPCYQFTPAAARKNDRIRIGYLSSDFHNHATLHLMRGVFRAHDRKQFGIYCYSTGVNDGSSYRTDVEATSEVFRDISHLDFSAAAKQIADDGIDILIDMKGWTGGARLEICALRPAPLLMSYLGYPGSTGADFIDYAIVDEKVVPAASRDFYSERLIAMPHCYQANDDQQEIADEPMTRRDAGLPENAIVFCSFNRPEKIDPVMFDAWMRIMTRVPHAVLWLMAGNRAARANLVNEAARRGLSAERLIFADAMPKERHLRRSRLADLMLDTRIVNGHTTTSDALWAGLPVITLTGKQFASRVSESCLDAVGLPELVTHTLDEYEALAVQLAEDAELRRSLRTKLWANRLTQPMFDTRRFTCNLENAYRNAWMRYCDGKPAEDFKMFET